MANSRPIAVQRAFWYPKSVADYDAGIAGNKWTKAYEDEELFPRRMTNTGPGSPAQSRGERTFLEPKFLSDGGLDYDNATQHHFDHTTDGTLSTYASVEICTKEGGKFDVNTKYTHYTSVHYGYCADKPILDETPYLIGPRNYNTIGVFFEWNNAGSYWGDSHISFRKIGLHYYNVLKRRTLFVKAELTNHWGANPEQQYTPNSSTKNGCLYRVPAKDHIQHYICSQNWFLIGVSVEYKNWAYKSSAHTRIRRIFRMMPYIGSEDYNDTPPPGGFHEKVRLVRTAPLDNLMYAYGAYGSVSWPRPTALAMQVYGGIDS